MRKRFLFLLFLNFSTAWATAEDGPTLEWKEVPEAKSYHIEISRDQNFTDVVLEKNLTVNSFKWLATEPGTYFWRVRAMSIDNRPGEISTPAMITIHVPPPKLIKKIRKLDIIKNDHSDATVLKNLGFEWQAVNFAKSYELEISKDLSFKNPKIMKTHETSLHGDFVATDSLYWRVLALDENGEMISRFSEVGTVNLDKTTTIASAGDSGPKAYVEPQTDDLLHINGKRYYLETIETKIIEEKPKNFLIAVQVAGQQDWNTIELKGSYRCYGADQFEELTPTNTKDIWSFAKKSCSKPKVQFCLSGKNGQQTCSAWINPNQNMTSEKKVSVSKGEALKPFWWNGSKPLFWTTADGRSMQIIWDKFFEKEHVTEAERNPPTWYVSGLLGAVQFQNPQSNILLEATGQAIYWPESSPDADLNFNPKRIGAQFRYTGSLATLSSTGQNVDVSWADASANYRFDSSNVFEGEHFYGILSASSYTSLGSTVNRLGGGLGVSLAYPKPFLGINYSGRIYTYADVMLLPVDVSGDHRGNIFSSKINGIWLFDNHWFLTGDLELRLLNYAMTTENSVFRLQLGGGFAF